MIIEIEIKSNYGREAIYAINPVQARSLSQLTGQKTLTRANVIALHDLGFKFEVAANKIPSWMPDSEVFDTRIV
jgi:membrane-anchored protein YejM (alkaline phosphatase superfamily)